MAGIAEGRLREERRSWRKDHPIGVARPRSKADGSTDLLNWDVRPRRSFSRRIASMAWSASPTRTPSPRPHHAQVVIPAKRTRCGRAASSTSRWSSSDYPATAPVVKFVSRPGSEVGNLVRRIDHVAVSTPSTWSRRVCAPRAEAVSRQYQTQAGRGLLAPKCGTSGRICLNLLNEPGRDVARPVVAVDHDQAGPVRDPGALLDNPFPPARGLEVRRRSTSGTGRPTSGGCGRRRTVHRASGRCRTTTTTTLPSSR